MLSLRSPRRPVVLAAFALLAACSSGGTHAAVSGPAGKSALGASVAAATATGGGGVGKVTVNGIYVALGDSFSAGEGNGKPYLLNAYLAGSAVSGGDECHRSPVGWVALLSKYGGPDLNAADFRACSGARLEDIFLPNHNPKNAPHEPPQINQLDGTVGLVTMTMGGNNMGPKGQGIGDLLSTCLKKPIGTCHESLDPQIQARLKALDGTDAANSNPYNLVQVYRSLRAAAPHARILIGDYPLWFDGHYPLSCDHIDPGDQPWANSIINKLDDIIRKNVAAADAGIEFVDVRPLFVGHSFTRILPQPACPNPDQAFIDTNITQIFQHEGWFHPNQLGQNLYARAFAAELHQPAPALTQASTGPLYPGYLQSLVYDMIYLEPVVHPGGSITGSVVGGLENKDHASDYEVGYGHLTGQVNGSAITLNLLFDDGEHAQWTGTISSEPGVPGPSLLEVNDGQGNVYDLRYTSLTDFSSKLSDAKDHHEFVHDNPPGS